MITITATGRLTENPKLREVNGRQVASFGLASRSYGPGGETTIFLDVSIWGARSNAANQYIKKGDMITIVGKMLPARVHNDNAYLKVDAYDFTLPLRSNTNSSLEKVEAF